MLGLYILYSLLWQVTCKMWATRYECILSLVLNVSSVDVDSTAGRTLIRAEGPAYAKALCEQCTQLSDARRGRSAEGLIDRRADFVRCSLWLQRRYNFYIPRNFERWCHLSFGNILSFCAISSTWTVVLFSALAPKAISIGLWSHFWLWCYLITRQI